MAIFIRGLRLWPAFENVDLGADRGRVSHILDVLDESGFGLDGAFFVVVDLEASRSTRQLRRQMASWTRDTSTTKWLLSDNGTLGVVASIATWTVSQCAGSALQASCDRFMQVFMFSVCACSGRSNG